MQTRSQTRIQNKKQLTYEVNIDFNLASICWKQNKIYKGNGTYVYKCDGITKQNKPCNNKCYLNNIYCKKHLSQKKSIQI